MNNEEVVETVETWYSVFQEETGRLVSVGTEVAHPLPEGLVVLETEGQPQGAWDERARAWVASVAPQVKIRESSEETEEAEEGPPPRRSWRSPRGRRS